MKFNDEEYKNKGKTRMISSLWVARDMILS